LAIVGDVGVATYCGSEERVSGIGKKRKRDSALYDSM